MEQITKQWSDAIKAHKALGIGLVDSIILLEDSLGKELKDDEIIKYSKAWVMGYEVITRYRVVIGNTTTDPYGKSQRLCRRGDNYFFCGNGTSRFCTTFTEEELYSKGFGWVFKEGYAKVA